MFYNLNLLHLVIVLGALACVHLARREVRGRPMSRGRLFMLPLLATLLTLILLLFHLAHGHPLWTYGAAFGAGVAGGALRGATMKLQVDQTWLLMRPSGRSALVWVTVALAIAIGLEIGGSIAGPEENAWRYFGAEGAAVCAGLLLGRACAFAARLWRAPHVELRRM